MSLLSVLPRPRLSNPTPSSSSVPSSVPSRTTASEEEDPVPPYHHPLRDTFRPDGDHALGDGGALPEIHQLQYPLGMGRKEQQRRAQSTAIVQLQVDASGKPKYDAILTQNTRADVVVYANPQDLVPKQITQEQLAKPSEQDIAEITEKTRAALEVATNSKIAAARPRNRADLAVKGSDVSYFRYKPANAQESGIEERIVKIQDVAIDPLEPPKFKHKKAPARPPSPPVPIMHSPPRKVSKEELAMWKIPSCVSNWKNIKGYTITIEQRVASDGRGLIEPELNEKHAEFADTLYLAERGARKALEEKAQFRKQQALQQKEQREAELRELARKARAQRTGLAGVDEESEEESLDEEDLKGREERDQLRMDLERDRRREFRMSQTGTKRSKRDREMERDISERVALGQGAPPVNVKGDSIFDQRMFDREKGIGSGFTTDDSYNLYDKPLFQAGSSQRVYRPTAVDTETYGGDDDVKNLLEKASGKFRPDRGFSGASESGDGAPRSAPVQFEREKEADPFGIDKFLSSAKSGKRLEHIGQKGFMSAAGGGSGSAESYAGGSSSRKRMQFVESSQESSKKHRRG